jgi:lipid II:glycine glycyltransferase (peptidoglycan interpeptide bridge formation enzyme)
MEIQLATDSVAWDAFLALKPWTPFLQSWTMGDVYKDIEQEPVRLVAMDQGKITGICFGHVVHARRGKHLSIPYGPVIDSALDQSKSDDVLTAILKRACDEAKKHGCSFVRLSPFFESGSHTDAFKKAGCISSPLHLLAEHVWYLPLKKDGAMRKEEEILAEMRKTTRNLIRRAEKEGVTIETSADPMKDLPHFMKLHDETRSRHGFTPYTNSFFRAQVKYFTEKDEVTLYLARYQGEVIAASIHMHTGGETSYHHGASGAAHRNIPASYLLQWRAIQDAIARGDRIYNFWGIAPRDAEGKPIKHPFNGVTLFKTGFGGQNLDLVHCMDIPVNSKYWLTRAFEMLRKWRRGF